jgi:hypothetical protein
MDIYSQLMLNMQPDAMAQVDGVFREETSAPGGHEWPIRPKW